MTAPLYDALRALAGRQTVRLHMPGHKGAPVWDDFAPVFALDFTETYETGNLYTEEGPIRQAEEAAAPVFGAADCLFLTGGSTQGVLTMLRAAVPPGGTVLLDRNCHRAAAAGLALLDLHPLFVYPETVEPFGIPGRIDPDDVSAQLDAHPEIAAVLITSPNYYGLCQDMPALAERCRAHGVPLLVDGAHAAHFPALGLPLPTAQGAALCTVSAHKTLPALGQAACLLSDGTSDRAVLREASRLFGTSSPSYPILASIDRARDWMAGDSGYPEAAAAADALRARLARETPFLPLHPDDPCRLTLSAASGGMTGYALADRLWEEDEIAVEMADPRTIVCILTPFDRGASLDRLTRALLRLGRDARPTPPPPPVPPLPRPRAVCPVRQAFLAPAEQIPLTEAAGRICARPLTPYPPGVPVLYPGEEIDAKLIAQLGKKCYTDIGDVIVLHHEIPHQI